MSNAKHNRFSWLRSRLRIAGCAFIGLWLSPHTGAAPGDLDVSFGGDGQTGTSFAGLTPSATGVALQRNGRVIALADCVTAPSSSEPQSVCVARFLNGGTLDSSFGNAGLVTHALDMRPRRIALQSDGKLLILGACTTVNLCVLRLNVNGSVDTSYGSNGLAQMPGLIINSNNVKSLVVQPDGKALAGLDCKAPSGSPFACAARFTTSGGPDPGFGVSGASAATGFSLITSGAVLQSSGKIVLTGQCASTLCATRLNTNGTLDTTFGVAGLTDAVVPFGFGAVQNVSSGVVGANDAITIASYCTVTISSTPRYACAARFTESGARDVLFGLLGETSVGTARLSSNGVLIYPALQPDGKMLLAESCFFGSGSTGTFDMCSVRFDSDGGEDETYGTNGRTYPLGLPAGTRNAARGTAINRDGIYVVGECAAPDSLCVRRYEGGPYGAQQCGPDIDGDGTVSLDVDTRLLLRASLGFTGIQVTQGILFNFSLSRRTSWSAIREFLNGQCGMSLAP